MTKEEAKAMFIALALSNTMGADPEQIRKEAEAKFEEEWAKK